jgi:hypothetical protein
MKAFTSIAPMSEELAAILKDPNQARELGDYLLRKAQPAPCVGPRLPETPKTFYVDGAAVQVSSSNVSPCIVSLSKKSSG